MRAIALLLLATGCASQGPNTDWRVAGGDPGNTRSSPLDQINTTNVAQLRVAWVYHTGDLPPDGHGEIQATPIVVDGVLYTTTPALAVIALHAESGTLLWRFDPRTTHDAPRTVAHGPVIAARIRWTIGSTLPACQCHTNTMSFSGSM